MLAIERVKGPADGVCLYRVRLNRKELFTFQHDRRKGMANCFEQAAKAANEYSKMENDALLLHFIDAFHK